MKAEWQRSDGNKHAYLAQVSEKDTFKMHPIFGVSERHSSLSVLPCKHLVSLMLLCLSVIGLADDIPLPIYPIEWSLIKYPKLPFSIGPELPDWKVPECDPDKDKIYDKAYLIAWSGYNDRELYISAVRKAVDVFKKHGAEVTAFVDRDTRLKLQKADPGVYQVCNAEALMKLVSDIKTKNIGKTVSITIFISNHGVQESRYGYFVNGPVETIPGRGEERQAITMEMLGLIASELRNFDVRLINGSCYGANTNDAFAQGYLRAQQQANSGEARFCSAALAAWRETSFLFGSKAWEESFLTENGTNDSFLQASFRAATKTLLGRRPFAAMEPGTSDTSVISWNSSMTSSESILYWKRYIEASTDPLRSVYVDFRPNKPDEFDCELFTMGKSETLPDNARYAELYKSTKLQTEQFIDRMGLSQKARKLCGIGPGGAIDWNTARAAATNPSRKKLSLDTWEWHLKIETVAHYRAGLYRITNPDPDDDDEYAARVKRTGKAFVGVGKGIFLSRAAIVKELKRLEEQADEFLASDFYKTQVALMLIKRLSLMLDFLNQPDEQDPLLRKQKELFAWYRACELRPLLPTLARNPAQTKVTAPAPRSPADGGQKQNSTSQNPN